MVKTAIDSARAENPYPMLLIIARFWPNIRLLLVVTDSIRFTSTLALRFEPSNWPMPEQT